MNPLILISILIISSGLIGGYANYHRYESNQEFHRFNFRKSILIGIVSASTVPLFLQMVSSNLLTEADNEPTKYFVFVGFCLIAAFFSNRFLQSVADKVIKDIEDVKRKTDKIEEESNQNKEKVNELIEDKTDYKSSLLSKVTLSDIESNIDSENLKKIYKSFQNENFKFRTVNGIASESGIPELVINKAISSLKEKKLVKQFKGKNEIEIFSMTNEGKELLKK